MKIRFLTCVPVLALAGVLSVSAAPTVPVTKLTKDCKALIDTNLKIPKVPVRGYPERAHKRISRALEKLAEENYAESIELFKNMMDTKDQYVRANVAKYIGFVYAQQSKSIEATEYFSQALDLGKGYLQHKEIQDLTRNVAAMLYGNDLKEKSIEYLKRWMKNSNEHSDDVYILYAAILFDSGKTREAICPAYWAAKYSAKPNKSAFDILLNGHFEFKDFQGTIALLKQLILDFPTEKRYWRNLASVYMNEDMVEDSLAVMEMFYVLGYMETENDYKQLSSIFAYSDIPYRTASILKEGIEKGIVKDTEKNWNNVASNFHVASELDKAIEAYERSAAKSDTGEYDVKQAELLSDRERYKQAVQVFDRALSKGKLKDVGKVHFRKGVAYLEMKQYNRSIASFREAQKYKKWKKQAEQYLKYASGCKANAAKL